MSDSIPASASASASASSSLTGAADVASTLLKLLASFPSSTPNQHKLETINDLYDGICLLHFLHELEPVYFELEPLQLSNLDQDITARQTNLQYLLDCLETFFEESLGKTMDFGFLNVTAMASDPSDDGTSNDGLLDLLELVLLGAINSGKKEDVIHSIMGMDDTEQQTLMNVIHAMQLRVDKEGGDGATELTASLDASTSSPPRKQSFDLDLSLSSLANSGAASSNHAATLAELTKLQSELAQVTQERDTLHKTIDQYQRDMKGYKRKLHESDERYEQLQTESARELSQVRTAAKEELERTVTNDRSKNDLARIGKELTRAEQRITELEFTNKTLQDQLNTSLRELTSAQSLLEDRRVEIAALTDELQLAHAKQDELQGTQSKMEKLKQRLSELDDLRTQLSQLEKENGTQLDRIIELESEAKEIDTLKQSLTRMKDTAFQAESQLLDKTLSEEQAQNALKESKDECLALRQERKELESQLKSMKIELEETREKARTSIKGSSSNSLGGDFADTSDSSSSDDKTTIKRLEYELSKLRAAANSSASSAVSDSTASDVALLKQQKDSLQEKYLDSQRKLASLTSDVEKRSRSWEEKFDAIQRTAEEERERWKEEKEELFKQLADLTSQQSSNDEIHQLRTELSELHEQLATLRGDINNTPSAASGDAPKTPSKSSTTIVTATAAAELEALTLRNKKLEAYIKQTQRKQKLAEEEQEKTRQQLQQTHEAYKIARQQLIDRERELVDREKARVSDTAHVTRERKLLSAAFYSIGMEYQTAIMAGRAVNKNGTNTTIGRSWLSQQRASSANQS